MLTEYDLHLFNEGTLHRAYQKLGAHRGEVDGIAGVHFAVWAPNARQVSVIGDFNGWDAASHPMKSLGVSGIWETFVPEAGPYQLINTDGYGHLYAGQCWAGAPGGRRVMIAWQMTDLWGMPFNSAMAERSTMSEGWARRWRSVGSRV